MIAHQNLGSVSCKGKVTASTFYAAVAVADGGQSESVIVAIPHPVEHCRQLALVVGQRVTVVGLTAARSHPHGSTTYAVVLLVW